MHHDAAIKFDEYFVKFINSWFVFFVEFVCAYAFAKVAQKVMK